MSNAVKTTEWKMTSTETESAADGNMGQTKTNLTTEVVDLEGIQAQLESWYGTKATKWIGEHKEQIYQAALA